MCLACKHGNISIFNMFTSVRICRTLEKQLERLPRIVPPKNTIKMRCATTATPFTRTRRKAANKVNALRHRSIGSLMFGINMNYCRSRRQIIEAYRTGCLSQLAVWKSFLSFNASMLWPKIRPVYAPEFTLCNNLFLLAQNGKMATSCSAVCTRMGR